MELIFQIQFKYYIHCILNIDILIFKIQCFHFYIKEKTIDIR